MIKENDEHPALDQNKPVRKLNRIAAIATLGGVLFGFDTGVVNGALQYMSRPDQLNLNPSNEGLVASGVTIGAAFGALFMGRLADIFGRKKLMHFLSLLLFFGTLGCSLSPNLVIIVAFRILVGLGVGGVSVVVPTYLSEMSPFKKRGQIVTRNELMIVGGQLTAFIINAILGLLSGDNPEIWRYMLACGMIPAIALFFGSQAIPESPRWLVMRGKSDKALSVLNTIRTTYTECLTELKQIKENLDKQHKLSRATWNDIKQPHNLHIIIIGAGLGIMQQMIGINIIMYYGSTVLANAGFGNNASLIANIGNGAVGVIVTIIGMKYLINKVNRRKYLLIGITGTTISLLLLVLFSKILAPAILPYFVVVCLMLFIAFDQGSIGPLVWLLLSEIFPQKIRGFGMGISTFFLWFANFLVGYFFPILLDVFGLSTTFLIFAGFNVISWIFAYSSVPETLGKTLEQIENN